MIAPRSALKAPSHEPGFEPIVPRASSPSFQIVEFVAVVQGVFFLGMWASGAQCSGAFVGIGSGAAGGAP